MKNKKNIVFTIIAKNYYKYAYLLTKSYLKLHPNDQFFVVFVDNQKIESEIFTSINVSELNNIPNIKHLQFKYDILEFSTAVKPYFIDWALKKFKPQTIIYLDPDIYVYKLFNKIFELLNTYECVLTPHITEPYNDGKNPSELEIFKSGLYNLGFVAFKNTPSTKKFIDWWKNKVYFFGYSDPDNFMFTDQKWMDFAPSYLNTYILKDKGYDVAYWNLHEYIEKVPIKDIVFFHFSGLQLNNNNISKYQNRFVYEDIKEYSQFYNLYKDELFKIKIAIGDKYSYPFNQFDNNVTITKPVRKIYAYITEIEKRKFNDPFAISNENSFFNYLIKPVPKLKNIHILNFFYYLYKTHTSISNFFTHLNFFINNKILLEYIYWCINFSDTEYDVPEEMILIQRKNINHKFFYHSFKKFQNYNFIYIIEKIKRNYNNEIFIEKIYHIILHRNPDPLGMEKNLSNLVNFQSSKDLVLYRLINSPEYRYKHTDSILIKIYKLYLLINIFLYKTFLPFKKLIFGLSSNETAVQDTTLGINISGYFDTESGVGESARGIVNSLLKSNIEININNIEQPWLKRDENKFNKLFTEKHKLPINLICVNADQLINTIQNDLKLQYLKNKYNIGYWYWESDIFTHIQAFSPLQEIWVATDYVYNSLKIKSPIPVIKIPPSFEPKTNSQKFNFKKHNITIDKDNFVFLNLFDSNSFWERKNPFSLIKAFQNAFGNNQKVKLIIKTTNIKDSEIYTTLLDEINKTNNIILIDGYFSQKELQDLMYSCNSYISLHRSEGLGIPFINAMMEGKPTIATGFGGNIDFMNINNSFQIKYASYSLKGNIGPYPKHSTWAEVDIEHATFVMKNVIENYKEALKTAQRGKSDVTNYFHPSRIFRLIENRIETISEYKII